MTGLLKYINAQKATIAFFVAMVAFYTGLDDKAIDVALTRRGKCAEQIGLLIIGYFYNIVYNNNS